MVKRFWSTEIRIFIIVILLGFPKFMILRFDLSNSFHISGISWKCFFCMWLWSIIAWFTYFLHAILLCKSKSARGSEIFINYSFILFPPNFSPLNSLLCRKYLLVKLLNIFIESIIYYFLIKLPVVAFFHIYFHILLVRLTLIKVRRIFVNVLDFGLHSCYLLSFEFILLFIFFHSLLCFLIYVEVYIGKLIDWWWICLMNWKGRLVYLNFFLYIITIIFGYCTRVKRFFLTHNRMYILIYSEVLLAGLQKLWNKALLLWNTRS